MSERTVKVKCKGLCKRMRLTLQSFDDFQENIRRRFDLGTEEMSVKAILNGYEDENDVTKDEDLQEWWNDLVELRITTIQPQIEIRLELKTVEINGAQYRLDIPMAENSPIVQDYIDQNHLGEFINETKAMTAVVGLLNIASVAGGDSKVINGMNKICISMRGICGKTRRLMSGYQDTSSHILETFQRMVLYSYHNQSNDAVMAFATVDEFVKQSCEDTSKLIKDIEEGIELVSGFAEEFVEVEEETKKECEKLTKQSKKTKTEISCEKTKGAEIKAAIDETQRREDVRKEEGAKVDESTSVAARVGKTGAVGAVGLAGAGVASAAVLKGVAVAGVTRTVARFGVTGALIVAPIFLLVAIGGGIAYVVYKDKNVEIGKEGQKNREDLQLHNRTKMEVQQNQIKLYAKLKELSRGIKPAEKLLSDLLDAKDYIKKMNCALQDFNNGWEGMRAAYSNIQISHAQMKQHADTEDCSTRFESDAFKLEIVHYYARWVAMKVFARRCNESLKASAKELEETMHITREEAKARLEAAKEHREDPKTLALCTQSQRLELKTVEIYGVQYRLDVPMAENSPIVQYYIDRNRLGEFVNETKAMAFIVRIMHVECFAGGDSKLINRMNKIGISTRGIYGKTRRLMSGYEETSSHILEKFQQMVVYSNQNQRNDAVMAFATVDEFVKQSSEDTRKLITDIKETMEQVSGFAEEFAGVIKEKIEKELEELRDQSEKTERDLSCEKTKGAEIEAAIDESHRREDVRKQKDAKVEKSTSEVEQNKTKLDARLKELSRGIEPGKHLKCCLQVANNCITEMNCALQDFHIGWEEISEACSKIQILHGQMKPHADTEDCSKRFESDAYKLKIVHYYARWVAMKVFARQCNESHKALAKELEETIHMTRAEAKARLEDAKEHREDPKTLALCTQSQR